jgi:ribosome-binding protein aMBF1 (putative translation factor)
MMRDEKRQRLNAKGWRIGSTDDFLGLTPEESAFLEIKLRLSHALRAEREAKRLTQSELAQIIHSSQSRVAKMEACDPTVSLDLLVKAFLSLGTSPKELAKVITVPLPKAA